MSSKKSHSISVFLNSDYPAIDRGEGIYLFDTDGKRYIDASSGPITCSLGHGVKEIADTMKTQAEKTAFVYRMDFTTPVLEECCSRICEKTSPNGMNPRELHYSHKATASFRKLPRSWNRRKISDSEYLAKVNSGQNETTWFEARSAVGRGQTTLPSQSGRYPNGQGGGPNPRFLIKNIPSPN